MPVKILSVLAFFSYFVSNLALLHQHNGEIRINLDGMVQQVFRGKQTDTRTYQKKEKMGLSLWLVPPAGQVSDNDSNDGVYERVTQVIDELSASFDGPKFSPHVTIVGGIRVDSEEEIKALSKRLRDGLANFGTVECNFKDIIQEPTCWNQALIIEMNPSERFLELCRVTRRILNMELETIAFPLPAGVPHMSLFYGDSPWSDAHPATNQEFLSRIFDNNGRDDQRSFQAHRVMLWKTDPPSAVGVPEWEPMADISLL